MKQITKRSFALLFFSLLMTSVSWSQAKAPAFWQTQFHALVAGIPRVRAEKEIERVRKVKSTYELWAMDTSALSAYKLDEETILLVTYKPGVPAAHGINGQGGHPPWMES